MFYKWSVLEFIFAHFQRQKYKAFKQTVDVTFKNLSKHLQKKLEGKKKKVDPDKQEVIPDIR